MRLSEKLRVCRKKNNMTQEQFAKKLNVSRKTVSGWENGRSFPDIETLVNISNNFDISIDQLLKNSDNAIDYYQLEISNYNSNKRKTVIFYLVLLIFFCLSFIQLLGLLKLPYHITILGLLVSLIVYAIIYPEWFKLNSLKKILRIAICFAAFFTLNCILFVISNNLYDFKDVYIMLGVSFGSFILSFFISISAVILLFCYPSFFINKKTRIR